MCLGENRDCSSKYNRKKSMCDSLEEKPPEVPPSNSLSVTVFASCVQQSWDCTIIAENLERVVMLLMVVRTTTASTPGGENDLPEYLCVSFFCVFVSLSFTLMSLFLFISLLCVIHCISVKGTHSPCIPPSII